MKNKVLINVIFPELGKSYNVFIPVNEVLWKVKKLILRAIQDLENVSGLGDKYIVLNKSNGLFYKNNEIIYDTDIRNGTELVFISNYK